MTYGSKSEAGFDAWLASAVRTVLLPTGTWIRLVIPTARRLRLRGIFPDDLLPTVKRFEGEGIKLDELEDDEAGAFLSMMNYLIADAIRSILVPDEKSSDREPSGEWQEQQLHGADLDEAEIDEEDLSALQAIVLRKLTPNQVTIASRRDRELARLSEMSSAEREAVVKKHIDDLERQKRADAEIRAEEGETVPGYRSFRDERSGHRDGESGGTVGSSSERARRHRRRVDRGSGRRGDSRSTGRDREGGSGR